MPRENNRPIRYLILLMLVVAILYGTLKSGQVRISINPSSLSTESLSGTGQDLGLYSDANAASSLTYINWGNIKPGSAEAYMVYLKNLGSVPLLCSLSTQNWTLTASNGTVISSSFQQYFTVSWDYENIPITPTQIVKATITLQISGSINAVNMFNFNIVIAYSPQPIDGYFTLNGQQINQNSMIRITNPALSFSFVITAPGVTSNYVNKCYIDILQGSTTIAEVSLTPYDSYTFTGSYTLPQGGTYTLNGNVTYETQELRFMSIVAPYNGA